MNLSKKLVVEGFVCLLALALFCLVPADDAEAQIPIGQPTVTPADGVMYVPQRIPGYYVTTRQAVPVRRRGLFGGLFCCKGREMLYAIRANTYWVPGQIGQGAQPTQSARPIIVEPQRPSYPNYHYRPVYRGSPR